MKLGDLFKGWQQKLLNKAREREEKKAEIKSRPEDDMFFDGLDLRPTAPTTDFMMDIRDHAFYVKEKKTLYVSEIVMEAAEYINYQEELQAVDPSIKIEMLAHDPDFLNKRKAFLKSHGGEQKAQVGSTRRVVEAKGILKRAMEQGASDIHIDTNSEKNIGMLRFRIGGLLQQDGLIPNPEELLRVFFNQLAEGSDSTFMPERMQNAVITNRQNMPEGMIGVRIVSAPKYDGSFMVMRLQKEDDRMDQRLTITDRLLRLGYTMRQASDWMKIMRKPTGLVIISGKVGSGKTKTLAVVAEGIQEANPGLMIQTVENPIEIPIPGVRQQSIKTGYGEKDAGGGEETGSDAFSQGINVALRSDPNILVISEVRTPEEAFSAFKGADTGHLLFTTIHANSAISSIPRFQSLLPSDKVPDPYLQMSDIEFMNGVCYQRLVQVLCNHCKIPVAGNEKKLSPDLVDRIKQFVKGDKVAYNNIYIKGEGCDRCRGRGYSGRTVIAEVIAFTPDVLEVYGKTHSVGALKAKWAETGGVSYRDVAMSRMLSGMMSPIEFEKNCGDISSESDQGE